MINFDKFKRAKKMKKVLVVASAGGHLTQAMCATSSCKNIVLVSNKINIKNKRIQKTYKILDTQYNPLVHILNVFYAIYVLLRERPKAVFSTGGPIVLPFALICKVLPIKFVFLDTLSRVVELSNSGKLINKYNLYDKMYSQWSEVAKPNKLEYIGKCFDILGENKIDDDQEYQHQTDRPMILVTIGTSDYLFPRALDFIASMELYNDVRVEWVIQAGDNNVAKKPANGSVVTLVERGEMEKLVSRASLVVSHCGIGSINQILMYKKHVIFIPRLKKFNEFSDDHQLQIANELKNGDFIVVDENSTMLTITYEDLISFKLLKKPIDITNYEMATRIAKDLG